jgi:hypothetical protein
MDPSPGGEFPDTEKEEEDEQDEICDNCGTELEWTLNLDGVQKRVCPSCDN